MKHRIDKDIVKKCVTFQEIPKARQTKVQFTED